MRRLIAVLTVLLLLSVVVGNAWGEVRYTVTDLGTIPGGFASAALGINNLGQVVGYATNNLGDQNAFLYSGGSMQDLGPGMATAINNLGQVVGSSNMGAFLYSGGSMQSLGAGSAYGINNLGQVVGWSNMSAFLYSGGSMQSLGTLSAPYDFNSIALGINDNGQVVGASYHAPAVSHAFLYSGGSMQDLGTLPAPYNFSSRALGINNLGQIMGYSNAYDQFNANFRGPTEAFLYSGGSMQDLGPISRIGPLDGRFSINNLGQVVGQTFLYSGGVMQDLNSLIVPGSGWMLQYVTGINDSGQICGTGINLSGQQDALLLTPVPEPSTFVLLGMGAFGLLAFAWRRWKRV